MSRKYVWKKGDGFSKSQGLTQHMAVAATHVVSGRGPFSITQDGDPISGNQLSRIDALRRYRGAIAHREIGSTFRIRRGDGDVVFTGRAVDPVDDADSTNGNQKSDIYYNWVKAEFHQYSPRYAGSYVCKHIAGSSSMSQHSYGNAVDFFFDTMTHQGMVANAVVANAAELHPCHVISGSHIWEPSTGWRYYSGEYHSHLHVDFCPQCSGGCGVRNC